MSKKEMLEQGVRLCLEAEEKPLEVRRNIFSSLVAAYRTGGITFTVFMYGSMISVGKEYVQWIREELSLSERIKIYDEVAQMKVSKKIKDRFRLELAPTV